MLRTLPRFTAAALAALLTLSACTSDDGGGKANGPDRFDPAAGAAALRELGAVKLTGEATATDSQAPIRGRISYGDPTRALQRLPFVAGSRLVSVDYRYDGTKAWIRRAPVTGITGLSLGSDLLVVRAEDAPPWLEVDPASHEAEFVTLPYDPAGLLDALAEAKVKFREAASVDVGGKQRAGFRAEVPPQHARLLGAVRVTVWTDTEGVPVRLRVVTPDAATGTYAVDAADGTVDVQAPPESAIERGDTPKPSAAGPYVEVTSGTAGTATYRILRAPATDGGTCWKVEADPAYVPYDTLADDGGYCVAPLGDPAGNWDLVGFPIDALPGSPYEMIGFVVPPGSSAEVLMLDGTTLPVPVDAGGLALYAGPEAPVAALVTVTLPDGRALYCAPGLIVTPDDVEELGPEAGPQVRREPWNCVFAADV